MRIYSIFFYIPELFLALFITLIGSYNHIAIFRGRHITKRTIDHTADTWLARSAFTLGELHMIACLICYEEHWYVETEY